MGTWEQPGGRRRWAPPLVVAVLAVAVAVALALAVLGGDDEGLEVVADATPTPAATPGPASTRAPRAAPGISGPERMGAWRVLPSAPVAGRSHAHAVWTGREVIVWGGSGRDGHALVDGAVFDPSDSSWRVLAEAPLDAGGGVEWSMTAAVWTGEEVVVLGAGPPLSYDPAADSWRFLPSPPSGAWAWPSAAWSGGEVVVLAEGEQRAVGYDPADDAWRVLPSPPVAGWHGATAVQVGRRLVVVGLLPDERSFTNAAAVYDPAANEWSRPDPAPADVGDRWVPRLAADPASGRVVVMVTAAAVPQPVLTWSPAHGWERLPDLPGPRGSGLTAVVIDAAAVVVWNEGAPDHGWWLGPGEAAWQRLTEAPLAPRRNAAITWTDEELMVWGGLRAGVPASGGAALRPTDAGWEFARPPADVEVVAGRWRQVAGPFVARDNPSLDWAGDRLLLWGGAAGGYPSDGFTYDPNADAWSPIADAPILGRQHHVTAWTGEELLVWGGDGLEFRDGAAYHPAQGTWRRLPGAPLTEPHAARGAWTGVELVVVAGPFEAEAAAYDPARGRWRLLPRPPEVGHRYQPVWTGQELIVVTDAINGTLARYDPVRDVWQTGADRSELMPTYGVEVGWSGEEVLVWGGHLDEPAHAGWAYHPGTDTWRRLPDAWLGGTLDAAGSAWTGTHWVVLGEHDGVPAIAAYDPHGDRWLALPPPPGSLLLTGPLAWAGDELVVWSMHGGALAFQPH